MGTDPRVEAAKARARERARRAGSSSSTRRAGRAALSSLDVSTVGRAGRAGKNAARQERVTNTKVMLEVFRSRAGKLPIVLEESADREPVKENLRPEKNFYFQQRHGKLDLRGIARIDLEQVVEDVDIETLQTYLENLAFAELEDCDLRTCTDETFLKLFRMTQLTIEYLLNVQHTLYAYTGTLEAQLAHVHKEQDLAQSKLGVQSEQLVSLQRELKQKRRTLKTYEFLLTQRGTGEHATLPPGEASKRAGPEAVAMQDAVSVAAATSSAEVLRGQRALDEKEQVLQAREQMLRDQQDRFEAQTEKMREMLQHEAEDMRRQLAFAMERQREEQKSREDELERREREIREASTKPVASKRIPSLAGTAVENDVDVDVEREVQEILMSANSIHDLRAQLAGVIDENQYLRGELNLALRTARSEAQTEAKKTGAGSKARARGDPTAEASRTAPALQDESLMLKLSGAQVSRELADRRSMQLRRVLRLVRRRLQHQAYTTWRLLTLTKRAERREAELAEEMERLRDEAPGPGGAPCAEAFVANYEWQNVPRTSALDARLELRDAEGAKQARIPRVWVLEAQSAAPDGAVIAVPVEREMPVGQVRERLARELGTPAAELVLRRRATGAKVRDDHTVQSANLFYEPVSVARSPKLSANAIEDLVTSYRREMDAVEKKSVSAAAQSPLPERPHIRAHWHHDPEVIAAVEAEIDSELSQSLGSLSTLSSYRRRPRTPRAGLADDEDEEEREDEGDEDEEIEVEAGFARPGGGSRAVTGRTGSEPATAPAETDAVKSAQESNVPVNFGDYNSPDRAQAVRSPGLRLDGSYLRDDGDSDAASGRRVAQSREALARRHGRALRHFARLGLSRRAAISTLRLSDDSGSSRTVTSISSQDESALGATRRSHFDVNRAADQYEDQESSDEEDDDLEAAIRASDAKTRSHFDVSRSADQYEDQESSDEDDDLEAATRASDAKKLAGSARTQDLLDEIEDDDSDDSEASPARK